MIKISVGFKLWFDHQGNDDFILIGNRMGRRRSKTLVLEAEPGWIPQLGSACSPGVFDHDAHTRFANGGVGFTENPNAWLIHFDNASTRSAGPKRMVSTSDGRGTGIAVECGDEKAMSGEREIVYESHARIEEAQRHADWIAEAEHAVVDGRAAVDHFLITFGTALRVTFPVVERKEDFLVVGRGIRCRIDHEEAEFTAVGGAVEMVASRHAVTWNVSADQIESPQLRGEMMRCLAQQASEQLGVSSPSGGE